MQEGIMSKECVKSVGKYKHNQKEDDNVLVKLKRRERKNQCCVNQGGGYNPSNYSLT